MKLSSKGAAFIRGHEGFISKWYRDPVGILTIGIGFTWRSDSFRVWWKKNKPGVNVGAGSMTRAEADDALSYLCAREYGTAVNKFLGHPSPQHVFDGMVSPVYNLGARALKWKWAAACQAGDYEKGAHLLTNTGTTAKGIKLTGLVRRRKEEALLISKGIYTGVHGGATRQPVDAMADSILERGERGPAVAALMLDLAALGYYSGHRDDLFGLGTESAVLSFQRKNGLEVDGYAGPITLRLIATEIEDLKPALKPATLFQKAAELIIAFIKAIFRRKK